MWRSVLVLALLGSCLAARGANGYGDTGSPVRGGSGLWGWLRSAWDHPLHKTAPAQKGQNWAPYLARHTHTSARDAAEEEAASEEAQRNTDSAQQPDTALEGWNSSTWAPVIRPDIAWRMANASTNGNSSEVFDLELGSYLAHINSIAYCELPNINAWNCSRCNGTANDFKLERVTYDLGWDLLAFVGFSGQLNAKVVAFRGTDSHSLYNWAENMRWWQTDLQLPYPGAKGAYVHTGFFISYNQSTLRPNVTEAAQALEAQHPAAPWYVVGHSAGSAMATICALDLRFTLGFPDIRVYTFGSPRVGNRVFSDFFHAHFVESWRVTHNRDIVPSVPLQIMGFHHVAREIWAVDFAGSPPIINTCDDSGEDPTCHNSVCYLGLCTSLADHMNYLGAHMWHRNPIGC